MDGGRFDEVARSAVDGPRRAVLGALAGAALAAILGRGAPSVVAACLAPGAKCTKSTLCCSGKCKKNKGQKKGRCGRCPAPFKFCAREGRCVPEDYDLCCARSDCASENCCADGNCFVECCEDDDCDEVCEGGFCVIV